MNFAYQIQPFQGMHLKQTYLNTIEINV